MRINKKFAKTNDYIVQIANILKKQHSSTVYIGLSKFKYTRQEVKDITHLLKLSEFNPENIFQMKIEQERTKLTDKQIKRIAELVLERKIRC